VILGGLIFFLVIVALILEKILSKAKSYEVRQKSILQQQTADELLMKLKDEVVVEKPGEFLTDNYNDEQDGRNEALAESVREKNFNSP
jgi:hypothetical protein